MRGSLVLWRHTQRSCVKRRRHLWREAGEKRRELSCEKKRKASAINEEAVKKEKKKRKKMLNFETKKTLSRREKLWRREREERNDQRKYSWKKRKLMYPSIRREEESWKPRLAKRREMSKYWSTWLPKARKRTNRRKKRRSSATFLKCNQLFNSSSVTCGRKRSYRWNTLAGYSAAWRRPGETLRNEDRNEAILAKTWRRMKMKWNEEIERKKESWASEIMAEAEERRREAWRGETYNERGLTESLPEINMKNSRNESTG